MTASWERKRIDVHNRIQKHKAIEIVFSPRRHDEHGNVLRHSLSSLFVLGLVPYGKKQNGESFLRFSVVNS